MPVYPWPAVRQAYATGLETYESLSIKFSIPYATLSQRAARESWVTNRSNLDKSAVDKAVTAVAKRLESKITPAAEMFVTRSLQETSKWMDRLENAAEKGEMNPDDIAKLVSSWRSVIGVGRTAHGLDATAGNAVQVNIGHLQSSEVIDAEVIPDSQ